MTAPEPRNGQTDDGEASDGRVARSQRTREAVVSALLDLLEDDPRPTAREIADRARVSLRSVYVHFDDVEDLFCAAADQQMRRVLAIVQPVAPELPLPERLDAFVVQRGRVSESTRAVRRAAGLQEPFSPTLARLLQQARELARQELATVFAPELAGDEDLEFALDALSSLTAWDHLRVAHGLGAERAQQIVCDAMHRLLSTTPVGGAPA